MKKIKLKEIQKIELDMLIELDKFCKKNKINYYLGCGTLAGAILEKGFFSWDDDIDILMKREDYEKFINSYNHVNYKVLTCNNIDYYYPYAKMVNTNTILYECKNKIKDYGVFIDIFPLDYAPSKLYLILLKPLRILMMSTWGCYLDNRNIIIKIIYKMLSILTSVFPKNFFAKLINYICKKNNKEKYKLMGVVCFHKHNREIMDKNIFNKNTKVIFEEYKFNTMKDYEKYLNNLYIDYKKDDNNHGHKHFDAYWK